MNCSTDLREKTVAILTTFYSISPSYSLCAVVEDQLRMFIKNDYKIKLVVDEGLSNVSGIWAHPNITLEKMPRVSRSNEGILPEGYETEVDNLYNRLKEILKDVKVVLAHDIILQNAHIIYQLATRMIADERPDLKWLHWSHSSNSPSIGCSDPKAKAIIDQKFPNSFICYPNAGDKKRVALNYGMELDEVKVVHHPIDFLGLMFGKEINLEEIPELSDIAKRWLNKKVNYPIRLSREFVEEFDVLNADVISVYPCRLDRGKQVSWNIKIMAKIKESGRSVKMIVSDFSSTGGDKVVYREELKKIGQDWGLELNKDLIFVSEWREDTRLEVSREFIMNLKKIADWNLHPSTAETFSLVSLESMMWRNFCVMNHHTDYLKSVFGVENILWEPMGSDFNMLQGENGATTINIHDESKHFENLAKKVLYFIEKANPVIAQFRFIRQNFNLDYIFNHQLEPLLYYQDLEEKNK